MKTPTSEAKRLFGEGNIKKALAIVKGFRLGLTKEEIDILGRGHQALVNPSFCMQIGKDPEEEINKASKLFEEKWINED